MRDEQERFLSDLFRAAYDSLFRFAGAKLGNSHRAEELVQDAFLIAQEKIETVMGSENAVGWMFNTLKNLIQHEYRARQTAVKLFLELSEGASAQPAAAYDDYAFEIADLFSPDEWWLLKKACIDRLPLGEIAAELGIEYEACKKRVQKLKGNVKLRLDGERGGEQYV